MRIFTNHLLKCQEEIFICQLVQSYFHPNSVSAPTWFFSPSIQPEEVFQNNRWIKKKIKKEKKKGSSKSTLIISSYLTCQKGFKLVIFTNSRYTKINLKTFLRKMTISNFEFSKKKLVTCRKSSSNAQLTQWFSLFDLQIKIYRK